MHANKPVHAHGDRSPMRRPVVREKKTALTDRWNDIRNALTGPSEDKEELEFHVDRCWTVEGVSVDLASGGPAVCQHLMQRLRDTATTIKSLTLHMDPAEFGQPFLATDPTIVLPRLESLKLYGCIGPEIEIFQLPKLRHLSLVPSELQSQSVLRLLFQSTKGVIERFSLKFSRDMSLSDQDFADLQWLFQRTGRVELISGDENVDQARKALKTLLRNDDYLPNYCDHWVKMVDFSGDFTRLIDQVITTVDSRVWSGRQFRLEAVTFGGVDWLCSRRIKAAKAVWEAKGTQVYHSMD